MNSFKLEMFAKKMSLPNFLGVFSVKDLNNVFIDYREYSIIICYLNHFVVFAKINQEHIYYDSLLSGFQLKNKDLINFLELNCNNRFITNTYQYQNNLNLTCAYHCLLFLYFLFIKRLSWQQIFYEKLDKKVSRNECKLKKFIKWMRVGFRR